MVSNNWEDSTVITIEGTNVQVVEDFCYLGSYLSRTGSCDNELESGKYFGETSKHLEKKQYQPRGENQAL